MGTVLIIVIVILLLGGGGGYYGYNRYGGAGLGGVLGLVLVVLVVLWLLGGLGAPQPLMQRAERMKSSSQGSGDMDKDRIAGAAKQAKGGSRKRLARWSGTISWSPKASATKWKARFRTPSAV